MISKNRLITLGIILASLTFSLLLFWSDGRLDINIAIVFSTLHFLAWCVFDRHTREVDILVGDEE